MARFISLFYAVVAAVTAASAAAALKSPSVDFSGPAYGHRRPAYWLPHASPEFDGSVSSVKIATGVKCTLWNEPECTGGSITLAADTPDLGALGFNDLLFPLHLESSEEIGALPWSKMGQLIHFWGEGGGGASVILTVLLIFYIFEPPLAIAAVSGHQWQRSSTKSGPKSMFAACWVRPLWATRPFRTPLILTGSCMSHKPPLAIGGQKAQPQKDSEV
ncbi:hypothetical protein B0H16DRAFT_1779251 [Mycena metata]|uniref:Uncharacterized protein n=1 Tax=Mycena metata TaxID=1033252 RepID=A0AAD7JQ97_9AGAR|nr:hypothetical protein B0H16DRAFT_1779251 [Mycena metata]